MKNYHRRRDICSRDAAFGLGVIGVVLAAACGTLEVRDLKDTFGSKSKGSGTTDQDWATVRIGLTPSQLLTAKLLDNDYSPESFSLFSFDLVNAASFKFKVSGCASGYTVSTTSVASFSTTLKLYKTDKNCEVGLVEFGYDSKTYSPQSVSELKGVAGNSAMFSAGTGDDLKVKVYRQLVAGGIVDGDTSAFTFLKSSKGANSNVVDYTAGSPLSVNGVEAPAFTISAINLTDVASADGKGTFRFTLQCNENLTQTGSDWACPRVPGETDPQKILDMHVKLIEDAANKSTYTYEEIETFMTTGATPTAVTNGMKVSGSSTNVQVSGLVGPGKLVDYKQMLFIVSYTDPTTPTSRGKSFVYFNVDIGDPVP
ncbi:MAG: hypothetical protein EBR09_11520 [Proteobacteria bacterium]|nr:hypothetical protein [Pseudomonadota bacterium]